MFSFKYYAIQMDCVFELKNLRVLCLCLCSDSALLGSDGILTSSLVMRYEKTHFLPSSLNINIYHEVKRVLIKCTYNHSLVILEKFSYKLLGLGCLG